MITRRDVSTVCWILAATIYAGLAIGTSRAIAQEDSPQTEKKSPRELRLEYAKANLELEENELRLAEQWNARVAETLPTGASKSEQELLLKMRQIPSAIMERLKSNVAIAREQLQQAMSPSTGATEKIRQRYAEEKVRLAEVNLAAMRADKARGLPVDPLELRRLELRHRLAKLKLELLSNPESVMEILDSLQRQIDRQTEQLMNHDQRITALEDR
jgi:hypothetical protein